jgi:predicted metal-dependent HD superfamily phosphohydrolase
MTAAGAVGLNGGMEDDHPDLTDLPWPLSGADALRDELLAAYADPSRGHHGTRHLAEVLRRLDELAAAGATYERTPVLLAAWFHDAVYDGERDAEERSATWAEDALPAHADAATVAEVARLVRLTEHHRPEPADANGCALSDADLSILAAPRERYDEYVAAVRAEYAHLADDVFAAGRAEVLRALTDTPTLFRTAHGRSTWEQAARDNVTRELAGLP